MNDYALYDIGKVTVPSNTMLGCIQVNNSLQDHAVKVVATEKRFVRMLFLSFSDEP